MRRAVFLLLLAVGSCLAAEVPVSTAQELLSALSFAASPEGAADTTVQLQVDIALNQEAAASFDLPFVIPSNHTLTLEGGGCKSRAHILAPICLPLRGAAQCHIVSLFCLQRALA
jgi:hypothetical protein